MNSEWPQLAIGSFARLRSGYSFKSADWKAVGNPVIKIANVKAGRIERSGCGYVDDEVAASASEWWTKPGDVLIAMTGYVGEVAKIKRGERYLINQRVGRFEFLPNSPMHSAFFFYVLQQPDFRKLIEDVARGSAQPNLSSTDALKLTVPVPPRAVQVEIAATLNVLDDRIALLRETNATLEAIAQALFKSWFVDFDPVRAKSQGLAPAGMDEATAALFPDGFEESALVPRPRGWQEGKVEDLLELAYGKALKATDRVAGEVPVYGSGGIAGHHNEPLVSGPGVVVGRKGTIGTLYWESRPFFPIDTVFYVRPRLPLTFCFHQLAVLGLQGMNTDGAVPGLNRNNVYRLQVVIPPRAVLDAFDGVVAALRAKMVANQAHLETLTTLRDTLLPRLISGQLRLPEIEQAA
jgi:type I restriction enzyme, S subunit